MVTVTMCTSQAALLKAGSGVNSTLSGGGVLDGTDYIVDQWITQAEGMLNMSARFNFTDVYSSLNDDVKKVLEEFCSNYAAVKCITYDMSGYTSRVEAEDMINVYRDAYLNILNKIEKDEIYRKYITGA